MAARPLPSLGPRTNFDWGELRGAAGCSGGRPLAAALLEPAHVAPDALGDGRRGPVVEARPRLRDVGEGDRDVAGLGRPAVDDGPPAQGVLDHGDELVDG